MGSVELTDAAGDVGPIQTSNKTYPGFDVVKLSIVSDGKRITVAATLKSPPADFASDAVELYFDIDNSKKTGAALLSPEIGGFAPAKAPQTPIVGAVVQASLDYDALKVASGKDDPARRARVGGGHTFYRRPPKASFLTCCSRAGLDALSRLFYLRSRAVPACRGRSTLGDKVYGNKTQAAEIGSVLTSRAGSRHSSEG